MKTVSTNTVYIVFPAVRDGAPLQAFDEDQLEKICKYMKDHTIFFKSRAEAEQIRDYFTHYDKNPFRWYVGVIATTTEMKDMLPFGEPKNELNAVTG